MKTWRKSKEFICPICKRDFDKKNQLRNHTRDAHPETVKKNEKEKS